MNTTSIHTINIIICTKTLNKHKKYQHKIIMNTTNINTKPKKYNKYTQKC